MFYNYDFKYLEFNIWKDSVFDIRPRLYFDYFYSKANLKIHWQGYKSFTIILGAFGHESYISFKWGHVERPKNKREIERMEDVRKMIEPLKKKNNM